MTDAPIIYVAEIHTSHMYEGIVKVGQTTKRRLTKRMMELAGGTLDRFRCLQTWENKPYNDRMVIQTLRNVFKVTCVNTDNFNPSEWFCCDAAKVGEAIAYLDEKVKQTTIPSPLKAPTLSQVCHGNSWTEDEGFFVWTENEEA